MGSYLIPELLGRGFMVDSLSNDVSYEPERERLHYFVGDARDRKTIDTLLENNYDGIINFMHYDSDFMYHHKPYLDHCRHYIMLSSYRVFTDFDPITTERSPRHIDASPDIQFRNSDDYTIVKARAEDALRASTYDNWTIARPSIVFSKMSFPLVNLGAYAIVNRARDHVPTYIAREALDVQSCITWSGDIAKMFAGIICNENAKCEDYNLVTSEHQSWGELLEFYHDLLGLEARVVGKKDILEFGFNGEKWSEWQTEYDRLLNRVMDNSKILAVAGLSESDITPVKKVLEAELTALPPDYRFDDPFDVNRKMDAWWDRAKKC